MHAKFPEEGGLEFETVEEDHHHDAEIGEVHDVTGAVADEVELVGADDHAGNQVAEDGAESEAFGEWHRDDGGDEVDEGVEEERVHLGERGIARVEGQ